MGAAGSVGMLASQLFSKRFKNLILIDKNREGLKKIAKTVFLIRAEINLIFDTSIDLVKSADVVFVATNTPGAIVRQNHLKPGSVVIDGAHPHNVSAKVPKQRQDVIVIESGIAEVDGLNTNIDFGLRNSNEVYSCLAEVLLLLWKPSLFDGLEEETLPYAEALLKYSVQAGIKPAPFQNRLGYIPEEVFQKIRDIRKNYYTKTEAK